MIINLDEDMNGCELVKDINAERIGFYVKNGEVLPTETAKKWNDMSALGNYPMNNILKKANKKTYQELMFEILQTSPKNKKPIFNLTDKEKNFAENFFLKNNLKNGKIIIGMNTGSGGRWQYKKWGIENTSKLIDGICEEFDVNILLLGGPEEVERNNKIKSLTKARIVDAGTNNSIREFASLISLCDMIITSDSLAMHIAIALKKYVIVFFGPTSLAEIEIYGEGEKIEADIECVCCYLTKCSKSPTCMDKLTVDIMFKAVRRGMNRIRYDK
jgi:heptosyltransferase-2